MLVYGASGAIGTAMVQLAKHFGASDRRLQREEIALVESLGADAVVDYTRDDFTTRDERYDVIFDAVGKRKSAKALVNARNTLTPGGTSISIDDIRPWLRAEACCCSGAWRSRGS